MTFFLGLDIGKDLLQIEKSAGGLMNDPNFLKS